MYGVDGRVLTWISKYLSHRCQKTKFNGVISDSLDIDLGVPQGSVLGPLLFIVYVNDIELCVEKCSLNLYADDTVIFVSGSDTKDIIDIINKELQTILQWLCINFLKINVSM